jgi:segregation and condensation protein B
VEAVEKRQIVEALLLASHEAVPAARLAAVLGETSARDVRSLVDALNSEYEAGARGFRIEEVAGGFQLRTLPELAPWLQKLRPQPPLRLSRASLETLAIVAYKQPITRAELEHVRGVDVGAVLSSLLERQLVRVAGHREVPGRPMLYATSRRFLEVFGLASLSDLPTLREIDDLLRERAAAAEAEAEAAEPPAPAVSGNAEDPEVVEEIDLDADLDSGLPRITH